METCAAFETPSSTPSPQPQYSESVGDICDREYYFEHQGTKIYVQEWGDLDKPVVMLVHGFPGSSEHGKLMLTSPLSKHFRLIAMDRPGYGKSDVQTNLTPMGFGHQMKALLDQKNIQEVRLLSVSGGAPFAMALAYLLKDRVKKLTSVGGVAPLTLRNARYMNRQQFKMWTITNTVPHFILKRTLEKLWKNGLENIDDLVFNSLDSFPEADRIVLSHPTVGPMLTATLKNSLMQGPGGVLHDLKIYSKGWGFPIHEILCPVTLWHGSADEVVNPYYAQEMKRRLKQAHIKMISQEGHYSLPMNQRDQILTDLLEI